ncbi:hypothetical protein [Paenibacillus sp. GCM10012306]|uniref:hypothetical protein n=1 Tax=Paenibacillus sp. GCM10012306 TaxID=3317342 RepID=UPI00361B9887
MGDDQTPMQEIEKLAAEIAGGTPGSTIAPRESVCVLVKVMPPDEINTEITLRLNRADSSAMQAWLAEAAE